VCREMAVCIAVRCPRFDDYSALIRTAIHSTTSERRKSQKASLRKRIDAPWRRAAQRMAEIKPRVLAPPAPRPLVVTAGKAPHCVAADVAWSWATKLFPRRRFSSSAADPDFRAVPTPLAAVRATASGLTARTPVRRSVRGFPTTEPALSTAERMARRQ
jgi:hypothetical protein